MKKNIVFVILILCASWMNGQDWDTGGNVLTGGEVLGSTNDFDLDVHRNSLLRMQFQDWGTWNGLNGADANNASRIFCGLDGNNGTAWSMLQLHDGGVSNQLYRSWFNVGTSYVGNNDFMYAGLLERPVMGQSNDATDAVIAWGCQDTSTNGNIDNFRFIFLEVIPWNGGNEASETEQGREMMRIAPDGNVGIGDFSTNGFGLATQPTHRLDVDGQVRVRDVPNGTPDVIITGVEQTAVGDYVLNYTDIDEFEDCDWTPIDNLQDATEFDIITGMPDDPDVCPEGNVGIGTIPKAKLDVLLFNDPSQSIVPNDDLYSDPTGIHSYIKVDENYTRGIYAENYSSGNSTNANVGGEFQAYNANQRNTGVRGTASLTGSNTALINYGGYFRANGATDNYGIWASGYGGTGDNYAGYFAGDVYSTGSYLPSDESLKQNVQDFSGALELVEAINLKTYEYKTEEFSQLCLPEGLHCGVIVQEVEPILPNIIKDIHHPEEIDDEGNLISEAVDFKAINYTELVPVALQAIKEQQEIIDAQEARMDELEAMILACCSADGKSLNGSSDIILKDEHLLKQNVPNPFELETEIGYRLATDGQVRVTIYNEMGQIIDVLVDQFQESGEYNVTWRNDSIARGVYFYSLEINGEELVRRMVKL